MPVTRLSPSIKLLVVGALTLALAPAMAQAPALNSGDNRLAQLKHLESQVVAKRAEAATLPDTDASKVVRMQLLDRPLDELGLARTLVGDVHGGLDALDERTAILHRKREVRQDELTRAAAASAEDAIAAIVRAARQRRIVIINESHHVPMHRAFTLALARELRKVGYTYFAAEAFSNNKMQHKSASGNAPWVALPVMHKGYVDRTTGLYSNDPVFANLLRDTGRDGWKFVAYEFDPASHDDEARLTSEQRQNLREAGQARNIVDRILTKDPSAKILIHAGYGHASKTDLGKFQMMAWHLKKMSGLDPLTVDQATMFQRVRAAAGNPLYPDLVSKTGGKPVVLRAPNGQAEVFGTFPGGYDLQVTHPPYPVDPKTGRAAWLSQLAGLKPTPIPEALIPASGRRLVHALRQGAADDEVPLDAVLLTAGEKAPMLMLPPGPFELKTQD